MFFAGKVLKTVTFVRLMGKGKSLKIWTSSLLNSIYVILCFCVSVVF